MNNKLLPYLLTLTTTLCVVFSITLHAEEVVDCSGSNCSELAQQYLETGKEELTSGDQLMPLAIMLLKQACDSYDIGSACALVSQAYYDGLGVEQNLITSVQYSSRGCDEVDEPSGASCFFAGVDYEEGAGVDLDEEKAHYYYEKGCELDDSDACWNTAYNYEAGIGVSDDWEQARKFYKKACELGDEEACAEL